jgi:hypothetical protein
MVIPSWSAQRTAFAGRASAMSSGEVAAHHRARAWAGTVSR